MPRPKNALSIEDAGNPYNPLSAADVWEWHKQNAADAWKAAQDPQTWRDAAQQYGQALLMGSIAPGGNSLGIRAFHGSPHNFDRFDLGKIGTGEGAQVYGHGLYFAQNEGVARGYRDKLQDYPGAVVRDAQGNDITVTTKDPLSLQDAWSSFKQAKGDYDKAGQLNRETWKEPHGAEAQEVQGILDDWRSQGVEYHKPQPTGHMYEVGINADPEHFLHWDKPLSEQSQHVQDALVPSIAQVAQTGRVPSGGWADHSILSRVQDGTATGADLHSLLSGAYPDQGAAIMQSAGIPGIKYLDGGSRDAGEGTHNYVVFNPENIEILRKYGLAGLMGGGAAAAGSQQGDQ